MPCYKDSYMLIVQGFGLHVVILLQTMRINGKTLFLRRPLAVVVNLCNALFGDKRVHERSARKLLHVVITYLAWAHVSFRGAHAPRSTPPSRRSSFRLSCHSPLVKLLFLKRVCCSSSATTVQQCITFPNPFRSTKGCKVTFLWPPKSSCGVRSQDSTLSR